MTSPSRQRIALAPSAARGTRHIDAGSAWQLERLGGELNVVEGRLWLTRDGDLGDHLVEAGERVRIGIDERAVVGSWDDCAPLVVRWSPRRQSLFGALLAEPLRGLAFLLGLAAGGFATLARSAAASASRAQGCIAGTDSMASSGALK